jgi:hypothetical protein
MSSPASMQQRAVPGSSWIGNCFETRINMCQLLLSAKNSLRAENLGRQEESSPGKMVKEKCKWCLIRERKIRERKDAVVVVSSLESRRCRVVNFLDGLALPAEGQKSRPRQQTRVLEMTSTESPHPARLRPTIADHCPDQPSLIKGGGCG